MFKILQTIIWPPVLLQKEIIIILLIINSLTRLLRC